MATSTEMILDAPNYLLMTGSDQIEPQNRALSFFQKTCPYMKTDVFRKDGILHEFF